MQKKKLNVKVRKPFFSSEQLEEMGRRIKRNLVSEDIRFLRVAQRGGAHIDAFNLSRNLHFTLFVPDSDQRAGSLFCLMTGLVSKYYADLPASGQEVVEAAKPQRPADAELFTPALKKWFAREVDAFLKAAREVCA